MRARNEQEFWLIFDCTTKHAEKLQILCLHTDSLLHDQIILEIKDDHTRKRLLQERKLNLKKCIDICKSRQMTNKAPRGNGYQDWRRTQSKQDKLYPQGKTHKQEQLWSHTKKKPKQLKYSECSGLEYLTVKSLSSTIRGKCQKFSNKHCFLALSEQALDLRSLIEYYISALE